jgi:hypothetical protein
VPDAGTSSNVNLGKEPLLGSESSSFEDAPPDGSNFRYGSDKDDDDEDVRKYVCAPRKRIPRQRYHTKQAARWGRLSLSGFDSLGLNYDDDMATDPVQRSPDLIHRSPDQFRGRRI